MLSRLADGWASIIGARCLSHSLTRSILSLTRSLLSRLADCGLWVIEAGVSRRNLACISLSIWLPGAAYALDPTRTLTQYVHRIWQVQQGLPEASIFSELQTRDGYLWLGTQAGLVRFDGVRFATLESLYPAAPVNVWIRSIAENDKRELWFGTNESGLYRVARGQISHFSAKDGLPSDTVQCVVAVKDEIWVGTPTWAGSDCQRESYCVSQERRSIGRRCPDDRGWGGWAYLGG